VRFGELRSIRQAVQAQVAEASPELCLDSRQRTAASAILPWGLWPSAPDPAPTCLEATGTNADSWTFDPAIAYVVTTGVGCELYIDRDGFTNMTERTIHEPERQAAPRALHARSESVGCARWASNCLRRRGWLTGWPIGSPVASPGATSQVRSGRSGLHRRHWRKGSFLEPPSSR
jgi:hypothetical protein